MNNLNVKLYEVLYEWDPFQIGVGNYDPEFADIIQAVHEFDDVYQLVERMEEIFQFSFEQIPTKKDCSTIATALFTLKNDESCTLG
ncbi:DUF1871 family protein [Bacillus sp. AK128]